MIGGGVPLVPCRPIHATVLFIPKWVSFGGKINTACQNKHSPEFSMMKESVIPSKAVFDRRKRDLKRLLFIRGLTQTHFLKKENIY